MFNLYASCIEHCHQERKIKIKEKLCFHLFQQWDLLICRLSLNSFSSLTHKSVVFVVVVVVCVLFHHKYAWCLSMDNFWTLFSERCYNISRTIIKYKMTPIITIIWFLRHQQSTSTINIDMHRNNSYNIIQ